MFSYYPRRQAYYAPPRYPSQASPFHTNYVDDEDDYGYGYGYSRARQEAEYNARLEEARRRRAYEEALAREAYRERLAREAYHEELARQARAERLAHERAARRHPFYGGSHDDEEYEDAPRYTRPRSKQDVLDELIRQQMEQAGYSTAPKRASPIPEVAPRAVPRPRHAPSPPPSPPTAIPSVRVPIRTPSPDPVVVKRTAAAQTIQSFIRTYFPRYKAFRSLSSIASEFQSAASSFTFPPTLDFAENDKMELLYTPNNTPLHAYEHQLMKIIQRLDAVESGGDARIRKERKRVVRRIEDELERVDKLKNEAWVEWKTGREREAEKERMVVDQTDVEMKDSGDEELSADADLTLTTTERPVEASPSSHFDDPHLTSDESLPVIDAPSAPISTEPTAELEHPRSTQIDQAPSPTPANITAQPDPPHSLSIDEDTDTLNLIESSSESQSPPAIMIPHPTPNEEIPTLSPSWTEISKEDVEDLCEVAGMDVEPDVGVMMSHGDVVGKGESPEMDPSNFNLSSAIESENTNPSTSSISAMGALNPIRSLPDDARLKVADSKQIPSSILADRNLNSTPSDVMVS